MIDKKNNKKAKDYREKIRKKLFKAKAFALLYRDESWKIINNSFATPAICYIALFLVSVLFLIISAFIKESPFKGILSNIGYGVFCSLCVAALADYGATRRKKERDIHIYHTMTKKLQKSVDNFYIFRIELNRLLDSEIVNLEYYKWIAHLFVKKEDEETELEQIRNLFIDYCEDLLSCAEALKEYSSVLAGNNSLKEDFFYNLDTLIDYSRLIVDKRNTNEKVSKKLFESICEIFPRYHSIFMGCWNDDRMKTLRIKQIVSDMKQIIALSENSIWH